MKITSCGIIPFRKDGDEILFLLVKNRAGHWAFPKGRQEKNETDLETAKREFSEETGITSFKVLDEKTFHEEYTVMRDGVLTDKKVTYFLGEVFDPSMNIQEEEISDYAWLCYEDALKKITYEQTIQTLADAFEYMRAIDSAP
ncbi:NUDIX domain-containing protein [Candidatus Uhrbacteria bacterium]|nr:NUDIX domain-containing protein [Candidatus Uhrbacteria bacterium]